MLQDAWPERQVEVFNLGITAAASFAVARTAEQALELDPDVVVVSTGHNEYYGVYGAASQRQGGTAYWVKDLHYGLMQTGMARTLRRVISAVRALASTRTTPSTPRTTSRARSASCCGILRVTALW